MAQPNPSGYAASVCVDYNIDSSGNSPCSTGTCYQHWYLPAICQMGAPNGNASCLTGTPNIRTNLPSLISGSCLGPACFLPTYYWSSSETIGIIAPSNGNAWAESFGSLRDDVGAKSSMFPLRCTRALT
jgi:hypothetical protein